MEGLAMFRLMRALWNLCFGWMGNTSQGIEENKHVMAATYDNAIQSRKARYDTVKNAVAELMGVCQDRTLQVKELGKKISTLTSIKEGAQAAMQKRVDALRAVGKSKEEIFGDTEFIKHKAAYEDASSTLSEVKARFDEKDSDLKTKEKQIAQFKAELQQMQRQNDSLREEKQEALADVAIAQQQEAINATLNGIPQDTADNDLQKAREARKRVSNRAHISAELAGNDAKHAESEYLQYAEKSKSNKELDSLLNWGDEPKKEGDLTPAKLPE
jgi:chromosome segregation ATPase